MDTRQIISTATEVTTIRRIHPGDVYKRTEDTYGQVSLRFGVVLDAMNNGVDSAITALEYRLPEFGGTTIQIQTKVWGGGEQALFPATPEEVRQHVMDLTAMAEKGVRAAEDSLSKAQETLREVQRLAAQLGELTAPETTTEPARDLWTPETDERVVYQPHPDVVPEAGVVTEFINSTLVRVRYDGEEVAKATRIADLTPEVRGG